MGLDLWFREDVARILASTQQAMQAQAGAVAPLDEGRASAYQQGFEDALRAVGVAFGVASPGVKNTGRQLPNQNPGGVWRELEALRARQGQEVILYDNQR